MALKHSWYLQPAVANDATALHVLLSTPQVYQYLLDGTAPDYSEVAQWIESSQSNAATLPGCGLWLLQSDAAPLAGFVGLKPYPEPATVELTYALHPKFWRMGLAARMGWTMMTQAFQNHKNIDRVIAGADKPNTASVAVMRRLAMAFLRTVEYPLGPGVEYIFRCTDTPPDPLPRALDIR